jgi:fucose permease
MNVESLFVVRVFPSYIIDSTPFEPGIVMPTFLCLYSIFLLAVNDQVFPSVLTQIGGSAAQQGLFLTSLFLLLPLASVFAGLLADRIGKKTLLIIGTFFLAFPFAASAFLENYWLRLMVVLSFGIGLGVVEGQASALLTDVHPGKERSMMNLSQFFFCAGAAGGPFFISLAYKLIPGLELSSLLLAVALFTFTAMMGFFFLKDGRYGMVTDDPRRHTVILRDRHGRLLLLAIFFYVAPEMGTAGWLAKYTETALHVQRALAPLSLTLFWSGLGSSRMLVGLFFHRMHDRRLLIISLGMSLIFQTAAFLVRTPALAFLFFFLFGFGMGTIWPTLVSMAGSTYRESTGSAVGFMLAAGAAAVPLIHPLIGLLSQEEFLGLRATLLCLTSFTALNLSIVSAMRKRER